jgi:DMSO/TMAO reductase YedYZ molybdopterin-dependent catalytic subunit
VTSRRQIVQGLGVLGLATVTRAIGTPVPSPAIVAEPGLAEGAVRNAEWVTLPGKAPLIKRTFRPPNLETPLEYFSQPITPNRAFFVRYHHALIPQVDHNAWRLQVGGDGARKPLSFSLDELQKQFEPAEVTALCLCSGHRRGLASPHVAGVQWGSGAMGTARWRGVRLKDILEKAELSADTVELAFDGADGPVLPGTPDFRKSLPTGKALDANTLVAFEMNGEPLPHWHGAPARLVVPGWTATYWMKHLVSIEARKSPLENFWMKTAYRIPLGRFAQLERFTSQDSATNTPITEIAVNSLVTMPADLMHVRRGRPFEIRGLAWDGGYGLQSVDVSIDAGTSWRNASLGEDYGRFAARGWAVRLRAGAAPGPFQLWVRATNRTGASQPAEAIPNPAGYHNNAIRKLTVIAS